ncbi:MAG: ABC transporter permease, partial [Dehalococcoidia bacterium]
FIIIIPILYFISGSLPVTIFFFPLVFIIYFWFAYGVGLCLASFYVYFRDINQIWEVLVNILFFLCPIFYPMASITDKVMPFFLLNPLTEFIIIFRDLMIYGTLPSFYNVAIATVCTVIVYIVGRYTFGKLQRRFAEEI